MRATILSFVVIASVAVYAQPIPIPNWHQLKLDWSNGLTFITKDGIEKPLEYGSCWNVAVTEVMAKWRRIPNDSASAATEVQKQYLAYSDHDYGADTTKIPCYVEQYGLYGHRLDVSGWSSERKWQLLKGSMNMGWPVIAGVMIKGRAYGHAIVIRQCLVENGVNKVMINDPSGDYYRTGKWDLTISGEGLVWEYDDFWDKTFLVIVPLDVAQALKVFIAEQ